MTINQNLCNMPKKYFKYIQTLFIVTPMSLIMAIVGTIRNHGFSDGLFFKIFHAWIAMFPVAFIAAFIIIPPAKKLAERVVAK